MDHYRATERTIPVRALAFTCALAAFMALRSVVLGFDLALGGVTGVMYMRLVCRANERLLGGDASVGAHATRGIVRIGAAAAISVFPAILGPWWGILIYFGGFFIPYVLFVLEVRRRWSAPQASSAD